MNTQVEAWFERAYIKGATHVLQSRGFLLKGTTRDPDRVQAKEVRWRIAGRGEAEEMSDTVEDAKVMNAGRDYVDGTLKDYQAAEYMRHPDLNKMSENEQGVIQTTGARALGRKFDNVHFEEFDGQAANIATIGDGSTHISIMDVREGEDDILGEGVNDLTEMFCPLPAYAFSQLMLWKQFSSSDYNGPDYPLAKMTERRKWGSVTYFKAPNELFTYDTGRGKDAWRTATWFQSYMWLKSCVGFATNYEMQSRITWENPKTAWFFNNWMPACVKTILPAGVKRMKFLFTPATIAGVTEPAAYDPS